MSTEEIKAKTKAILQENGVSFAGVFGSRARGDNRPDSDLDLLVRFERDDKSLLDLVHIQNLISDELGCNVDLVTEESLHPYIRDGVLKDLQVIYGQR